jgi:hypothetical protein
MISSGFGEIQYTDDPDCFAHGLRGICLKNPCHPSEP